MGGVWTYVGYIGTCNDGNSSAQIKTTIKGLTKGNYRMAANHEHFSWTNWYEGLPAIQDDCSASSSWGTPSGQSTIAVTARSIIAQTEIGTDGIASVWATNKYFHFSQAGLFVKLGDKTLEITESSVKINGITY